MKLPLIKCQFLAFKNVSINPPGLSGPRRDDGIQPATLKLFFDDGINLPSCRKSGSLLLFNRSALFDNRTVLSIISILSIMRILGGRCCLSGRRRDSFGGGHRCLGFDGFFGVLGRLRPLLSAANGLTVVCFVPLAVRRSVDLDDGALCEGICAYELVIAWMIYNDDNAGLAGAALRGPGKIARVQAEGAIFVVASTSTDDVDTLGTDFGIGGLAAGLESALLPV